MGTHKSCLVRRWLDGQNGHIAIDLIAFLPALAPELNPVEAIWACSPEKARNRQPVSDRLSEVSDFARRRLKSATRLWLPARRPKLAVSSW